VPPPAAWRKTETVAVCLEAKARKAVARLAAREARRLACLAAAEEGAEREGEALQRHLRRLRIDREKCRVLLADRRQAFALIGKRDRGAYAREGIFPPPRFNPFLKSGVV
jgi:hypothetical protein